MTEEDMDRSLVAIMLMTVAAPSAAQQAASPPSKPAAPPCAEPGIPPTRFLGRQVGRLSHRQGQIGRSQPDRESLWLRRARELDAAQQPARRILKRLCAGRKALGAVLDRFRRIAGVLHRRVGRQGDGDFGQMGRPDRPHDLQQECGWLGPPVRRAIDRRWQDLGAEFRLHLSARPSRDWPTELLCWRWSRRSSHRHSPSKARCPSC